jgi:hypothetical protein
VAPTINSFTPVSGSTGTVVTVLGAHFTGTMRVFFGGTDASAFTVVSDSILSAVVGTGSSGQIKVLNTGGLGVSTGFFTYIPTPVAPDILFFTPDSARQNDTVTLFGAHFDSVAFVYFGGVPASSFHIVSDSVIRAVVGSGASGSVSVFSSAGSDSLGGFTFIAAPSPGGGGLSIYPNPATGYVVAAVPVTTGPSRFVLADASGHVVQTVAVSRGVKQVTIPVGRFNKGVYKLVWSNGQRTVSTTVLLMK